MLYIAYHLHWSWTEIMGMELAERRAYLQMLVDRVEAENRAVETMMKELRKR